MPRVKFLRASSGLCGVCVAACVSACVSACVVASLTLAFCRPADAANPVIQLTLGKLTIRQQSGAFVDVELKNGQIIHVEDRSGAYWPPVATDSQGSLYIGDKVIDTHAGLLTEDAHHPAVAILGPHYRIAPDESGHALRIAGKKHACVLPLDALGLSSTTESALDLLKDMTLRFVDSSGPLVGLITQVGEQPADTRYKIVRIASDTCEVLSTTDLGNPDYLVEPGWSPGGHWWIAGSNLNTLLRSVDGRQWSTMQLPSTISGLIGAYIANDGAVWLAATDSRLPLEAGPLIVRSQDNGKTWTPLKWGDPLLREIPSGWLEGQMRANGRARN